MARASDGALWDDPVAAKAVMADLADAKDQLETARRFESHLGDAETALEMIADPSIGQDPALMAEVADACDHLDAALDAWETRRLLAGKYDALGATKLRDIPTSIPGRTLPLYELETGG